ncbi:MAG: malate synthase A, partial [Myxococcales bacterium]|nr:malate synthase A [Myxococcales bacterium]
MTTLVKVTAPTLDGDATLLTPEALDFLGILQRRFDGRRRELLAAREDRQARFDAGVLPDFLPETIAIRTAAWKVAPTPRDLLDRRVEITGPPDRKMVINALNSGASCFMADFEDSTSPTWRNVIDGQLALRDAVNGTLAFTDPASGKHYALGPEPAVLMVRPRGWHLDEAHVQLGGRPVSASLFDFGLYAFHNVASLRRKGTGAYFYLPKLEHHEEARLWDEVMAAAEEALDLPIGSLKVTVLIETLPAAFQLHEILFALQRRVVGLNCGRWDYIFSTIKTLREHAGALLPDRGQVGMTAPFMDAYTRLVVQTCHRR